MKRILWLVAVLALAVVPVTALASDSQGTIGADRQATQSSSNR